MFQCVFSMFFVMFSMAKTVLVKLFQAPRNELVSLGGLSATNSAPFGTIRILKFILKKAESHSVAC